MNAAIGKLILNHGIRWGSVESITVCPLDPPVRSRFKTRTALDLTLHLSGSVVTGPNKTGNVRIT